MKAIRVHAFGAPEVMKLESLPDPRPAAGQILVRLRAVGVNPVETYIRSGNYAMLPPLPYTPGSDGAGTIEAVAGDIQNFKVGDRVYTAGSISGTYAEGALCEPRHLHRLPENVPFEHGAAVGTPYATAYRALFQKAQVKPGETVLIHGASGGVGLAAVQLAVAQGLRVVGTAGSERGLQIVREQGAQQVLDHRQANYLETIQGGVDIVIEMLANVNLAKDLAVLARNGRVIIVGNRGSIEINPREIMRREATVHGVLLFNSSPEEMRAIHAALFAGLANGTLRPVIAQQMALADAPRAHETVMKSGACGKLVLIP